MESTLVPLEINPYEQQRADRIARNKRKLEELGLGIAPAVPARKAPAVNSQKKKIKKSPQQPQRRSRRVQGQEAEIIQPLSVALLEPIIKKERIKKEHVKQELNVDLDTLLNESDEKDLKLHNHTLMR